MKVSRGKLEGILLFKLDTFEDFRGEYVELFNEKLYSKEIKKALKGTVYENGARKLKFVEDDISTGTKSVLKGIHGDNKTWKLVSCLFGKFYLVVVNNNPKSKDYGKWESFTLSDKNRLQVLIPPLYGNGHQILSGYDIYHYKQSSYYDPKSQFTIKWNDHKYNIWWPIKNPILSRRDETGKTSEK